MSGKLYRVCVWNGRESSHVQMDLVTVEVVVEGTIGLYGDLPRYFSHLQKLPQHGSTTSHGEADQVVSEPEHRGPHHVPARILRVAGGEEVVGAVLQAPLARHHRHIPQGSCYRNSGPEESDCSSSQENSDEILFVIIHSLHQKILLETKEEIS